MESLFRFKKFSVSNYRSALKVGTDAVVLGSLIEVPTGCRRVLDVGTGTGVIALMVAQKWFESSLSVDLSAGFPGNYFGGSISAIDIDSASCEEAAENFANSPWAEVLSVERVRLQDYRPTEAFDLVFSNPPFFENSLKNPDLRECAARHTDSLSFRDLCSWCGSYLSEKGQFWVILPYEQAAISKRIAGSFGLKAFREVAVYSTPRKSAKRVVFAFSRESMAFRNGSSCDEGSCTGEERLILNENGRRSDAYSALVEDYLL